MTKGWSRFVREKGLETGDTVSFYRGAARDRIFIDWKRRANVGDPHRRLPRISLPTMQTTASTCGPRGGGAGGLFVPVALRHIQDPNFRSVNAGAAAPCRPGTAGMPIFLPIQTTVQPVPSVEAGLLANSPTPAARRERLFFEVKPRLHDGELNHATNQLSPQCERPRKVAKWKYPHQSHAPDKSASTDEDCFDFDSPKLLVSSIYRGYLFSNRKIQKSCALRELIKHIQSSLQNYPRQF